MPKIETYTGSGGITSVQRTSASDFVDVTGLKEMSKSLSDISEQYKKTREVEGRLAMAREMAEGRQKWMLELDARQQKIEAGEMDYRDLTKNFITEYSKWADEVSAKYPGSMGQELRINLTEMQNPFIGSAMNFEASQRAKKIKENYDATTNAAILSIRSSRNTQELEANAIGLYEPANVLPPDAAKEYTKEVDLTIADQQINIASTEDDIYAAVERIQKRIGDFSPSQVDALANKANSRIESLQNQKIREVEQMVTAGLQNAKEGGLGENFEMEVGALTQDMPPEKAQPILEMAATARRVNDVSNSIWDMGPAEFSQTLRSLENKRMATANELDRNQLAEEIMLYQKINADKQEMLAKDFAGSAMRRSQMVGDKFMSYQESIKNKEPTEIINKKFSEYVKSIDDYADKIKYGGRVRYLAEAEVDGVVNAVNTALAKENGMDQAAQVISGFEEVYGDRFGAVMEQVRDRDPALGALTIVSRIAQNGDVNYSQYAKNELVKALSLIKTDSKVFDQVKATDIIDSNQLSMQESLLTANMSTENQDRRYAYEMLAKMYITQGDSASTAREKAYKTAYGDIAVQGRLVYPAAKKSSISMIIRGANNILKMSGNDIVLPAGTDDSAAKRIMENPSNYIEYITSPNGDGLTPVWKFFGNGTEPVLQKSNGRPVKIKWGVAESYGISNPNKNNLKAGRVYG